MQRSLKDDPPRPFTLLHEPWCINHGPSHQLLLTHLPLGVGRQLTSSGGQSHRLSLVSLWQK
jgi:hypothetical protein